jgi:hypothetical protein
MATNALRLVIGTVLAGAAMLAHAETVGRVLLAAGDALAVRDGKQVRLLFNAPIESKDVLRTGNASSLQVRFIDDGMISLRENSEFVIEEYRFSGKEDGSERGFFNLVKGGFRAVTGAIGKTQNANYKVRTETATIGIRGTDYAARDCRGDCGSGVKNGLYGTVMGMSSGTNQVTLTNNTGEHVFGISQNFYVSDANSVPQQLLQPPTFVSVRPQGKAAATQQGGSGTGGEQASSSTGAAAESRPAATTDVALTTPLITQPFQVTQSLNSSGTPAALPPANGFVVVYPLVTGFGNVVFDNNTLFGTFNGQNQLLSYGTTGAFPAGSLGGGSITDTGSVMLPNGQTFVWGRWTGSTLITVSGGQTLGGVPLLFGTATGLQRNNNFVGVVGGSASYNYAGGPKPVDAGGNLGMVTGSSLAINFTQLTANYSLAMNFPSVVVSSVNMGPASFSVSGTASHQMNGAGEFSGSLSGTCTGGGCFSGAASGGYEVGLTGTQGFEFAVVGGAVGGTKAGGAAFLNAYTSSSFTPGAAPTGPLAGQIAWYNPFFLSGSTFSVSAGFSTFDASNNLTSFSNPFPCSTGSCTLSGTVGTGSIANTGSLALVDGSTMYWGRWVGGKITDRIVGTPTMYTPPTGVPFVLGSANTIVPASGSFTYTFSGGPLAVDNAGTVGSALNQGVFLVNFGATQTISVATPLTLSVGGVNYTLSSACGGSCSFPGPAAIMNMALNGNCTGGACSTGSPASSNATGFLVGPQAGGLAVAGNISSPASKVTFAGGFKR